MSFSVQLINSQKVWDNFINTAKPHTFLQSWEWGEFNQAMGDKIWRIGVSNHDKLIAVALVIKIKARRGSFLFCPHGPVFQFSIFNFQFSILIDYLKNLAQAEGCSFIRISSLIDNNKDNQALFRLLGFRTAPIHMHSENAWILNLKEGSPESVKQKESVVEIVQNEILSKMRKTHRNLIRKARRQGVKITKSTNLADLTVFGQLYRETVNRQKFAPFSFEYLKKEFEIFKKENKALIFLARFKGKYLAGAIIIFDTESAFYHHGASSRAYAHIPCSYLLQWEVVLEALKRGLKFYNFWGIAPLEKKNHPWAGLTLFKQGFGGFREEYLPAQDLVLKFSYWFTYAIEKTRKWRRRL